MSKQLIKILVVTLMLVGLTYPASAADTQPDALDVKALGWPPTVIYNYSSYTVYACDNVGGNQPGNCRSVGAGQIEYNDTDWLIVPVPFDLYHSVGFKGSYPANTGLRYSDANAVYVYNAGSGRASVHGWGPGYIQIR